MATVQHDPELRIYPKFTGENEFGNVSIKQKEDCFISAIAVDAVLVVDGDEDVEHHEIVRPQASEIVTNTRASYVTSQSPHNISNERGDTINDNTHNIHERCAKCAIIGDTGCVITCSQHRSLPYAFSVSSSPEIADSLGSRSSSSTFSGFSSRFSETPSIASELGHEKYKDKGKGKEIVTVTAPPQVYSPVRLSIESEGSRRGTQDSRGSFAVPIVEREGAASLMTTFPPRHHQYEPDEISVIAPPRVVHVVHGSYTRTSDDNGVLDLAFEEQRRVHNGERGPVGVPTTLGASAERSDPVYRRDVTRKSSYKWMMLVYLTVINPLICFTNAFLTIALLGILTITYSLHRISWIFLRRHHSQSILPTTSSTVVSEVRESPITWTSYFSIIIRKRLSSPLFFHHRIMYQTSDPAPSAEEWDAGRLVAVLLLAPIVSVVPCGVAAWAGALMWIYSVVLGEETADEVGGGQRWSGTSGATMNGERDRGSGGGRGEFYALRFVRKQWERWLWSALR